MAGKKRSAIAAFLALSDAQKQRVFERFAPGKARRSQPLSAGERAQWERAKRGPGRRPTGEGAEPINVTIERGLLRRAVAYAVEKGLTRARLIAIALESLLPDPHEKPASAKPNEDVVGGMSIRRSTKKSA
jgi:hypothetical protein